jgi:hypothetical protein
MWLRQSFGAPRGGDLCAGGELAVPRLWQQYWVPQFQNLLGTLLVKICWLVDPFMQLEELVNTPERNALTARAYASLASGRRGIVFCVGVQVRDPDEGSGDNRAASYDTAMGPRLQLRDIQGRPAVMHFQHTTVLTFAHARCQAEPGPNAHQRVMSRASCRRWGIRAPAAAAKARSAAVWAALHSTCSRAIPSCCTRWTLGSCCRGKMQLLR